MKAGIVKRTKMRLRSVWLTCFVAVLLFFHLPVIIRAQEARSITLAEAIEIATKNNAGLKSSSVSVEQSKALMKSAFDLDKPILFYNHDANNLPPVGDPLNVWGIEQSLRFPTIYGKQKQVFESRYRMQEQQYDLDSRKLALEVTKSFYTIVYLQDLLKHYVTIDSIYSDFAKAAEKRYSVGETNYLEKVTTETKRQEAALHLKQTESSIEQAYVDLNRWLQIDEKVTVQRNTLAKIEARPLDLSGHPGILYYEQWKQTAAFSNQLERNKLLPDIHLTYFQGRSISEENKIYPGVQVGLGIPLWFGAQRATINASELQVEKLERQREEYRINLNAKYSRLQHDIEKFQQAFDFYNTAGKKLATETLSTARKSFLGGEINFLQYVQAMDQSISIEINHLQNLYRYNLTVIEMNYLVD